MCLPQTLLQPRHIGCLDNRKKEWGSRTPGRMDRVQTGAHCGLKVRLQGDLSHGLSSVAVTWQQQEMCSGGWGSRGTLAMSLESGLDAPPSQVVLTACLGGLTFGAAAVSLTPPALRSALSVLPE